MLGSGKSFLNQSAEAQLAANIKMQNAIEDLGNRIRKREYEEEIAKKEKEYREKNNLDAVRYISSKLERFHFDLNGEQEDKVEDDTSSSSKKPADPHAEGEEGENSEDEDDDSWLDDDDDDESEEAILAKIRAKRMGQMKKAHSEVMEQKARGGGQLREITQDEFLPSVTGAPHVVCMFYSKDFRRCAVMEKHLNMLAKEHIECNFVKIDAEKAPFFVKKLGIRVLPTTLIFADGVTNFERRMVGFDGLIEEAVLKNATAKTDLDFSTRDLEEWLFQHKCIKEAVFPEDVRDVNARYKAQLGKGVQGIEEYRGNIVLHHYDDTLETREDSLKAGHTSQVGTKSSDRHRED